jgi:hypothetical protein
VRIREMKEGSNFKMWEEDKRIRYIEGVKEIKSNFHQI